MTVSTIKHPKISYSQGQRNVAKARILFIVWLLASGSPESALADPKGQSAMTSDTMTSIDPLLFNSAWVERHCPPAPPSPSGPPRLVPSANSSRLPRMVRTLMCCFCWPELQEIPDLGEPVAEGKEGEEEASSSQHPTVDPSSTVVAPSTATPSALLQLMSREDVPGNQELVLALNASPTEEQRQWISAAIQWFATQPIKNLSPAAIRDYAELARIRVTLEPVTLEPVTLEPVTLRYIYPLLSDHFRSLYNKARDGSFEQQPLIQALAYALAHIDPTVFADGNLEMLLTLACNLLSKLDPTKHDFSKNDYRSVRPTFEALFHTLLLIQKVAPGYLQVNDKGIYQHCKNYLQKITDRAQYYPVRYQARILKQILRLLEDPAPRQEENLKRVQGLLGAANLGAVGQELASLELKPAELQEGIDLLQKAFAGQRIQPKAWYRELLSLEGKMVQCLQQQELAPYPEPAALEQQAQSLHEQGEDLSILGQQSIQRDCKTFCFGIAMQLSTLALYGPTPAVRTGSIERLIALAKPEAWGADADVMAGLLDSLALVAAQSQAERATEAAVARKALERLAAEPASDSSRKPKFLARLFHHPQSPQDAASKAFSLWLAGEELDRKLQCLQEQTTEQTPSDKERFFTHVKQTLQRIAAIESFRAQEIENLSQLSSYILRAEAFKGKYKQLQPSAFSQLDKLTKAGQQLMQYAAYLDADFIIPLSLVSALIEEDNPKQLSEVVRDLWRLSLVKVVSNNAGKELGLQVHREVQASCREYEGWSSEAALGTQEAILPQLAEVLEAQMRGEKSGLAKLWEHVKLYAPHVATVVTALEDSGAAPSAVVARLLDLMGDYSNVVGLNYRQAVSYYQRALAIKKQMYQETPNHPDIASTLGNLGNAWFALGYAHQVVSCYDRALTIKEQAYKEAPNHPDIARILNNLGAVWNLFGNSNKAFGYLERALAIYKQAYKEVPNHRDIADALNNLGNVLRSLGYRNDAIYSFESALVIYEQVYEPDHPHRVAAARNLAETVEDTTRSS